jgi:hypothetical protein
MKAVKNALAIVRENRRAYIIINLVYYGLVLVGMVYVSFNPALQEFLLDQVGEAFAMGPLAAVTEAYTNGQVITATLLTFVINLVAGSLIYITLPSLVIPFSGFLVGILRAVLWGLLLSPTNPELGAVMIPHSITLILEGQAYVLVLLAVYVQGHSFLWPHRTGSESYRQGYLQGLKQTAQLYLLVIIVLAVSALYEVLEVIFLVPLLI